MHQSRLLFAFALLTCCSLTACSNSAPVSVDDHSAALTISIGPTTIRNGDAVSAGDFTVSNEFYAVAFSAESSSPWGVAKGGILDIAIVEEGVIGTDFNSLVDFMPNYWSAWPTTYQRIQIETNTPEHIVVLSERDFGAVALQTRFELHAASKLIRLHTSMTNNGDVALQDLKSGYIAWPNGGHLFGMPGLKATDSKPVPDSTARGDWSASYDRNWAMGLHAPFATLVSYGGRDRYLAHSLAPGETREFEAWLQVENNADLARFVQTEVQRSARPSANISGYISTADGQTVEDTALMIKRDERLYAWALADNGYYEITLPTGDYEIYAAARNYAPGESQKLSVREGVELEIDFSDIRPPGNIEFSVVEKATKNPLHASLTIVAGTKNEIAYFGKSRFFTQLEKPGIVQLPASPGNYEFEVTAGSGFTALSEGVLVSVKSSKLSAVTVDIDVIAHPENHNWYSADLHHHSDVLDGFTDPESVLRSQLAAGVNVSFLSDHDSVENNAHMLDLSNRYALPFIPGTELSASWGHFNAYPIASNKKVNPKVGQMSVKELFAEGRRLGAEIIHINHPYGNYGYFDSLSQEEADLTKAGAIVPGGYDAGYDLIEITTEHEPKTLHRAWQLWNQGKKAYFAAGSDVHDVWEADSGAARSYVHISEGLTVGNYIAALKAGHSFASQGPLIYPAQIFGSRISVEPGKELWLEYSLQAVNGLHKVTLIERGEELASKTFDNVVADSVTAPQQAIFKVRPRFNTWYSVVLKDIKGKYAYSNPLWVDVPPAKN